MLNTSISAILFLATLFINLPASSESGNQNPKAQTGDRVDNASGPTLVRSLQAQEIPDPRAHHQIVYHAGEQRVYLLGGSTRRGDTQHYFDDVWYWNRTGWKRADPLPFPRSSHRVVYHAGRNSLVLFGGGFDRRFAADGALWERQKDTWSRLGESTDAGRAEPGLCYDWRRERIVLFGGWDSSNKFSGTTLEWTGEALVAVSSAGPSPRAGHAFVYDPKRQRCLLFGGRGEEGYLKDTWEWDGAQWRRLETSGPSARWFFGAATDYANKRIVIFGGSGPEGDLGDIWAWDGEGWELLTSDGPAARGMAKLAFDGSNVVLFGGRAKASEGFRDLNDTWELQGRTWTRKQ